MSEASEILAKVRRILQVPDFASDTSIPFVVEQMLVSAEANQHAYWAAKAELEKLRQDKARLDWLESKTGPYICGQWTLPSMQWDGGRDKFRAAIDAAMEGNE